MASPSPQSSPMPPPQAPSPMGPPTQSPAPPQSPHSPYNQQHVNGPPPAHPPGSSQPSMQNHMPPSGPPHTMASNTNGGPQQHPGMPPSGHQMSPHMVGPHMPGPPGHPMGTPGHQGPGGPNGHANMQNNPQHPSMQQGQPHGYMQHQIGHMPPNQVNELDTMTMFSFNLLQIKMIFKWTFYFTTPTSKLYLAQYSLTKNWIFFLLPFFIISS